MSQPQLPQGRRKLLKSIALSGGVIAVSKTLPESWTKPVIDSVMLPAHAQVSVLCAGVSGTGVTLTDDNFDDAVALWISDESVAIATYGHISCWDVSAVTDMSLVFAYKRPLYFNEDISLWDVSNVEGMAYMFYYTDAFNQDISGWDVSGVTDMEGMFDNADALSDANKCAIHSSFDTKNPSVWPYDWSASCI